MQEFLNNDTVSANLMSLTGYRTLILFNLLLERPCSVKEIKDCFLQNKYVEKEEFSNDTLRIYLNSLRSIGCKITKATKSSGYKYIMTAHPFSLKATQSTQKALLKTYSNLYTQLDIKTLIEIERFFLKLSEFAEDESKFFFQNLSKIKSIDKKLLLDLDNLSARKKQVKLRYNSPRCGLIEIDFILDKICFKNSKLYIWGTNLLYKEYSYLNVDRIHSIESVSMTSSEHAQNISIKVKKYGQIFEISSGNKFDLKHCILENQYEVVDSKDFKNEIFEELKLMRSFYND